MGFQAADVSKEYEKNEELKKSDIIHLQEWVKKQPHLPQILEIQLIIFLHSCYYNMEAAKNTINMFFIIKARCPELFSNRDPISPALQKQLKVQLQSISPKLSPEGYVVIYCALQESDASKYMFVESFKLFDMMVSLSIAQTGSKNGYVIILDSKLGHLGHLTRVGLMTVKKLIHYVEEAAPVRRKAVHIVNVNPVMHKLFALIKPFVKKENIDMIHFHSKIESLYEFVPKECIPSELGGYLDSALTLHETTIKLLMDNREFFIQDELQISDESQRKTKYKYEDSFGLEGSFRKLDLD